MASSSRNLSTPLLPHLEKFVSDEWQKIEREKIAPWTLMPIMMPFSVRDFHGRVISYEGIDFDGSPRHRFWGSYIEPFLEDLVGRCLEETKRFSESRHQSPRVALRAVAQLLKQSCRNAYRRMGEVDQRLMEYKTANATIEARILKGIETMDSFINSRVEAELKMLGPWAEVNAFYKRNPAIVLLGSSIASALAGYFFKGR